MRASKRSQVPLVIAKVAFTNLVDAKLAEAKLVVKRFVDFASYSPISGASSAPLRSRNPLICSGLHGIGLESFHAVQAVLLLRPEASEP